jgi:hypothetical protein
MRRIFRTRPAAVSSTTVLLTRSLSADAPQVGPPLALSSADAPQVGPPLALSSADDHSSMESCRFNGFLLASYPNGPTNWTLSCGPSITSQILGQANPRGRGRRMHRLRLPFVAGRAALERSRPFCGLADVAHWGGGSEEQPGHGDWVGIHLGKRTGWDCLPLVPPQVWGLRLGRTSSVRHLIHSQHYSRRAQEHPRQILVLEPLTSLVRRGWGEGATCATAAPWQLTAVLLARLLARLLANTASTCRCCSLAGPMFARAAATVTRPCCINCR